MFYLAMVCAICAVIFATIFMAIALRSLYLRSKPHLQPSKSRNFPIDIQRSHPALWRITSMFGHRLSPFVTWDQRRRLLTDIERAGLKGWDFFQIYFLQVICSSFSLMMGVLWMEAGLIALRVEIYLLLIFFVIMAWWMPVLWLKRQQKSRLQLITQKLPFFLDMVGLGLDAGMNLQASVQLALDHIGSGPLHEEWSKMLTEMRAGQPRAQALRQLSQRLNLTSVRQLISSLIQGEAMGFSLGRIIQVYADQQRSQRLMQAEKQALQAPVKMLFPMALCIFPCTFIILGFPVVIQLLELQ